MISDDERRIIHADARAAAAAAAAKAPPLSERQIQELALLLGFRLLRPNEQQAA